ncbi:Upstream activation factor subunit spp27 like [Actinidia chinensis var. chinensis]|uniref:Upstream activation factor subunit spp27 like n=1 Tax=Actinidia chinensis var. chinensis TaxID=1590841 RepID=A0A2R6R1X6_ACTCC|nr:Upstream activation factor subunit spp27 like [Actinidia chinensis var. chinensis]
MAFSLGVLPSFLGGESSLLTKSSSPPTPPSCLRLGGVHLVPSSPVNLRTVTAAAASKPASETGKREPRGIMKPRRVSPEMQAFLGGAAEIPRTEALKQIWAYIKQQNLQDPENKKIIVCDEKLKKIFAGKDRVGFLEVAGLINPHFLK